MKRTLAVLVAAVAVVAFAQDKFKIEPKFKADSSTAYGLVLKMNISGAEAELTGNMVVGVKSVTDAETKVEYDWQNGKAMINGEEQPVPFAATHVIFDKKGNIVSIDGGIEGTDVARTFLVAYAQLPTEALAKDESWKATLPKNPKLNLEERTVEGTYLGSEELKGAKAHKYKITVKETTNFTTKQTVWVDGDGKLLKLDGEFSELPLPIVSSNASGTVKLEVAGG